VLWGINGLLFAFCFTNHQRLIYMNKPFRKLILLAGIWGTIVVGCNNNNSPLNRTSKIDSTMTPISTIDTQNIWKKDINKFQSDAKEQIRENEDSINVFKERMQKSSSDMKAKYDQRVALLREKNEEMKEKLNGFRQGNRLKWDQFKKDFNNRMDTLDQKIKKFEN
jgi:hypothetical protein